MRKGVHAQVVVDDDVYSKKKKWKIFLWIAAGVVVIFGGLFGGMYYYFSHMQDNDTSSDDNRGGDVAVEQDVDQAVDYATQDVIVEQHGTSHDDAVQQHDAVAEKVPVILYFEQISEETKRHRAWPTVRIFRKVGSGNPEMLADVGKIGEYPSGFLMSPDHRFLLINLESKLQMLDIATKKLTDIFIPKKEVRNVIFSPDGAQLMI